MEDGEGAEGGGGEEDLLGGKRRRRRERETDAQLQAAVGAARVAVFSTDAIAYELRGTVRTEYAPTGVVCKMVVPLIEEIGPIEEEPGAIGADSP